MTSLEPSLKPVQLYHSGESNNFQMRKTLDKDLQIASTFFNFMPNPRMLAGLNASGAVTSTAGIMEGAGMSLAAEELLGFGAAGTKLAGAIGGVGAMVYGAYEEGKSWERSLNENVSLAARNQDKDISVGITHELASDPYGWLSDLSEIRHEVAVGLAIKDQVKAESVAVARSRVAVGEDRCGDIQKLSNKELAYQYMLLATEAYDFVVGPKYNYTPDNPMQRGRHIHRIVQEIAEADKELYECGICKGEYPFEIEQSYFNGYKVPRFFPGNSTPDLHCETTGESFDIKTGVLGTSLSRHNKLAKNVRSDTGFVTSCDVTIGGVVCLYTTPTKK
jgi:hypothetical protein